jgi:NADPH:quinone reductase-like Zn-dependent oxidoreductase
VHSAAGGVGSALVQLGRLADARVVGVVGAAHKVATVLALGAEAVIDKSHQDLWREAERLSPEGYGVVLDANGVSTLMQSYRHLAPAGKLVVYGFASMLPRNGRRTSRLRLLWDYWRTPRFDPLRMSNANRSVLAFNLSFLFDRTGFLDLAMGQLLAWLAEGRIRMPQVTAYPLENAAAAQRALEGGQTVGKLILTLGADPPP